MTEFEEQLTAFLLESHEKINAFRDAVRPRSFDCPSSGGRLLQELMEMQTSLREIRHHGKALCHDIERHEDVEPSGQTKMVL